MKNTILHYFLCFGLSILGFLTIFWHQSNIHTQRRLQTLRQKHAGPHHLHYIHNHMKNNVSIYDMKETIKELEKKLQSYEKLRVVGDSNVWDSLIDKTHKPKCYSLGLNQEQRLIPGCTSELPQPFPEKTIEVSYKISYFIRQIATKILENGFRIPVHVVDGSHPIRRERIAKLLENAGFQKEWITWHSGYLANSLTETDRNMFVNSGHSGPEQFGPNPWDETDHLRCMDAFHGLSRPCHPLYGFSNGEMSCALKHASILEMIALRGNGSLGTDLFGEPLTTIMTSSSTSSSLPSFRSLLTNEQIVQSALQEYSPSSSSSSSSSSSPSPLLFSSSSFSHLDDFSFVVEDDQYLPLDLRRQIIEILLQSPSQLGAIMMDDSFFYVNSFYPPRELIDFPFPTSYVRNESRTTGAYLISHQAAHKIRYSGMNDNNDNNNNEETTTTNTIQKKKKEKGHYLPFAAPADHSLAMAIKKEGILTHWVFPPMTCAGSEGIESLGSTTGGSRIDAGDRLGCQVCCDRFYNLSSMEPLYQLV